jgi:hypothetical protein
MTPNILGEGARPNSESFRPPGRELPLRLRRLAWFCGFARFWRRATRGSAPAKIFIGNGEDIVFDE